MIASDFFFFSLPVLDILQDRRWIYSQGDSVMRTFQVLALVKQIWIFIPLIREKIGLEFEDVEIDWYLSIIITVSYQSYCTFDDDAFGRISVLHFFFLF